MDLILSPLWFGFVWNLIWICVATFSADIFFFFKISVCEAHEEEQCCCDDIFFICFNSYFDLCAFKFLFVPTLWIWISVHAWQPSLQIFFSFWNFFPYLWGAPVDEEQCCYTDDGSWKGWRGNYFFSPTIYFSQY